MRRGPTALMATAAAVTLAVGVPAMASGASAAGSWVVQQVPLPSGGIHGGSLAAVSCATATSCFADGEIGVNPAAVERWDGSAWTAQTLPLPPETAAIMTGVSCPSATACTAVGYSIGGEGNIAALAEGWNGTAWTQEAVPVPAGQPDGKLTAVSCASAANCTALSTYTATVSGVPVPLSEHWNGSAWKAHATAPPPAGATSVSLETLSCPSATSCIAIGGTNAAGLAERWNGSSWTLMSTPPTGAAAVSCFSAANCTGVGTGATSAGDYRPVAEHWNGSAWHSTPVRLPSRVKNGSLVGVSCPSASRCTAVGWWNRSTPTGLHNAWAEVWNGTTWRNQPTAQPPKRQTLSAVSCVAARTCTAVGVTKLQGNPYIQPLAEHE